MNKEIVNHIEKQIFELLSFGQRHQPGIALADSCSEVSRLVVGWMKVFDTSLRVMILKGTNVCGTHKAHDVLAVITTDNHVSIIDPTIWQFFPQAQSIMVCIVDTLDTALDEMKAMYGGKWEIREEVFQLDRDEERKYLDIVARNIRENVK